MATDSRTSSTGASWVDISLCAVVIVAACPAEPALVDDILPVRTDDAKDMARRLAREEALFAGTSSGANVVAAIQVAERLGPDAKVVTLLADSGLKYLSTDVYRRR